jgi:enolase
MIVPHGFNQFDHALQAGVEIYHTLKKLLKDRGLATNVGDEGGFAPNLNSSEEVLKIIIEAVEKANYKMEEQVSIALDAASSEFYDNGTYLIENEKLTSSDMVNYLIDLTEKFPIVSIEDGLAEEDWDGWNEITAKIGDQIQLVGDDLFVTQSHMLQKGIEENSANSILIKVNQVGSISETYETMSLAQKSNFTSMVSHRSGETENVFISHLVSGTSSGQIKTGAPARSERTAKYNELLRIGEVLGLDNFNNSKWNS